MAFFNTYCVTKVSYPCDSRLKQVPTDGGEKLFQD